MSDSKMGKAKGWWGDQQGPRISMLVGRERDAVNLPQSRAALVHSQSAAGSGGQCKMEQEARFCTESSCWEKEGSMATKLNFLLIWLSQVLYIIVFMYVSWPCGSLLLHGLFLNCGEWRCSSLRCTGFSQRWLLLSWNMDSRPPGRQELLHVGSVVLPGL